MPNEGCPKESPLCKKRLGSGNERRFPATNRICATSTNDTKDPDLIQSRDIYINDDTSSSSPHCMAKFGLVEAVTLMDTGAEASVMQEIILDGLPKDLIIDTQPPPIRYCVGPNGGKMSIRDVTTLEFTLNGWTFQHPFLILRDLKKPIILGSDFFCQQNAVLYYQDHQPCEIILDSECRIPLFRADKITEGKYPDVPSIQCGPNYITAKTPQLPGCKNREPAHSLTTSIHNKIDGMTPEHRAHSPRRYLCHRQDRNKGFHRLHNEARGRRMLRGPARCQTPDRPITAIQSLSLIHI